MLVLTVAQYLPMISIFYCVSSIVWLRVLAIVDCYRITLIRRGCALVFFLLLVAGLTLQLCGIGMLFGWQQSWAANDEIAKAIIFVTAAQMLCGIAKDLTKLGGKTVTKLVTPDEKQVSSSWQEIAHIARTETLLC